ncbi:hypothetical protein CEP54_002833 [Fusarium duplospermum]|uniref:aldehyde dehydrogenase (NAD(+)) n=1 Tax=Fusarium duplospermum TaxID=1325734 RepID=A0A428QSR9_9HYPO|nr:hypothetical protein CEP54_002833 [Fusarium duplospermum]
MASNVEISLPNGLKYKQPTNLFINNKFVDATGDDFTVYNPATDEKIITMKGASEKDVDKAVDAARRAFQGEWSELAAVDRGAFLYKIAELIDRDRKLLASIDAFDNGKTYTAALEGDLDESCNVFRYYAGAADKITGRTIETSPAKLAYVLQEPLGVCGQIIPWNFPFMMLAWKVAPALACGNTVVLKPAEQTPLSAIYFGNLVLEAGLPSGVVNIIPGLGSVAGKALAGHMGVDKIAFTGSTATGRAIMKAAANNLKNITLKCGGKSPSIVFEDADLEQAVKWCHVGIMDTWDKFITNPNPLTLELAIPGLHLALKDLRSRKYIRRFPQALGGYYLEPTVFADTTEDMAIVRDEIFGPVVAIAKFRTVDEVVAKANDTLYGLVAALFTEKIARAHTVARRLQAGIVWINSSGDSHFGIPFGGYKSSCIGRELGLYALDTYTQSKAVH